MANIYPQRATDPDDLHKEMDAELHSRNLQIIKKTIKKHKKIVVVFAYGNLINKRPYLKECLNDINKIIKKYNLETKMLKLTKEGNPFHPLYASQETKLINYDMK